MCQPDFIIRHEQRAELFACGEGALGDSKGGVMQKQVLEAHSPQAVQMPVRLNT